MTVLNLKVNNGNNDGYSRANGTFNNTSTNLIIGMQNNSTVNDSVFCLFTGASGIYQGTINTAYIRLYSTGTGNGTATCNIRGNDTASPTAPTSVATYNSKVRTTSSVAFSSGSGVGWKQSNSIVPIIQELANDYNLSNILLLLDSTSSLLNYRAFASYENNPANAPELYIDYTPPNTPPTITVNPSVNYNGYTRLGPNNTPGVVSFTATDPEQTGSNALSYQIRTASGSGGTLVASGNFTSGTPVAVNIAHNASGLSEGNNTLYLRVSDGTDFAPTNPSFTLRVDRTQPADFTPSYAPVPVTASKQYTVTMTAQDTHSTLSSEMFWDIRTAPSGGGTLLDSGSRTQSATPFTTATITDSALVHGSNNRYIRVMDGANNIREKTLNITVSMEPPDVNVSAVNYNAWTRLGPNNTPVKVTITVKEVT